MPTTVHQELMDIRNLTLPDPDEVTIEGQDPVLPTNFRIGETCAGVIGAIGVAVSDIWERKTGRRQKATVNARKAAAALRSTQYMQRPDGRGDFKFIPETPWMTHMRSITQPWSTKDGRWFLPHFNLPNLRERVMSVLKCEDTPEGVAKAVAQWDALDLEAAIADARACGAMVRSNAEWLAHPHGAMLSRKPVVEIIKIADSDPEPFPRGERPLSGIRALDLTRILAGPIAARTLAEHGAEVLMVTHKDLPQVPEHVRDTSHGKRSCYLDLKSTEGRDTLKRLIAEADIFSQGYRPGVMARFGLSPEELAEIRPGVISVNISCYGADGPFSDRAGWEQISQTVTGILADNGADGRPALLPAAACDYTTGYLGAYGALLALARRAQEGGSYMVRVSLCQSGMMIYRQGQIANQDISADLPLDEVARMLTTSHPTGGELRHLGPVLQLSETTPRWERPTPVLGGDQPKWLQ